jgi:DNA replicative helicase MCM subunit Mcm2 (Cdc46/Mcm family)
LINGTNRSGRRAFKNVYTPLEERLVLFFKSEKYREMLREASVKKRRSIPVEFNDLIKFDEEFAKRLIDNPNVMPKHTEQSMF